MVKKKRPDEEGVGDDMHLETPDNKENNHSEDNSGMLSYKDESTENGDMNPEELPSFETGSSDKVDTPKKELEEKLAEMQDKYLRLSAEFDNYRKRTLREKMDLSKHAGEELLLKFLPIMDDFDRAVSNMESSADSTAMISGIDLIYVKFNDFLKQNGIREIECLNCPFNVDLHDAVAKIAVDEEDKKGKVFDVIQKGYYLQDKVIRHAKVVVGE
jgi:molecular chaperone GrpE